MNESAEVSDFAFLRWPAWSADSSSHLCERDIPNMTLQQFRTQIILSRGAL